MASLRERIQLAYGAHQATVGKLFFEIVIVFIGVTAAFALESVRRDREEAEYRSSIIAALEPTLDDLLRHNLAFETEVQAKLTAFDAANAQHQRPELPIFRESNSERPPVRIWDSVVATGAARALEPDLLFRLSMFYNRQDSFGERYVRYATYTEQHILTLGHGRKAIYDASGNVQPEYAAYVDRLRDLLGASRSLTAQAKGLRAELKGRD